MNGAAASVNELLVSTRRPTVTSEPFPYFCVDNYLPKDLYDALSRDWPAAELSQGTNRAGKTGFNSRARVFEEFLASSPQWARTVQALRSDEFIADLSGFLRPSLVQARGVGGYRAWRNAGRRGLPTVGRPVEFACEFSVLPPGAYLYPHTDKPEKLVSCLLYFADPNWESRYGGATDLYRAKHARHDRNWSNRAVTFDAVDLVFRSEFRPNRLLVFVKTRNSYHGVSPIACPPGMTRKSFNFNFLVPFAAWGNVGKRIADSYRWRVESWRFREFAKVTGQS